MEVVRQADDPFDCFGAKPNKGLSLRSRRDRKWVKELGEVSWRRVTRVGSRHRTAEVASWHEIGSRAVREDRSRWVGIPSSFVEISLEIHVSVSLHMHIGNAMLHNSPSCAWINPSILFVCSLSSHSLDCISCSYKEMCDAPIGTTSWSPAKKRNGSKKLMYSGGRRDIVTTH